MCETPCLPRHERLLPQRTVGPANALRAIDGGKLKRSENTNFGQDFGAQVASGYDWILQPQVAATGAGSNQGDKVSMVEQNASS